MVSFNTIPVNIRVPGQYIEIDNTKAVRGLPGMPRKLLVIGQQLSSVVEEGTPTPITHADQAAEKFGYGSMLHQMFEKLRNANDWQEAYAMPLDDLVAGTPEVINIQFAGSSISAGTVNLWVGGRRTRIGVNTGSTPAEIATGVAAAINENGMLAVTAAVNGSEDTQVDLTAKHKGAAGNDIDVRVNYYSDESLPTNLTATVSHVASGSGNPDIATAISSMGDDWYTDIIMPYTDSANLASLEAELDIRFGPLVMQDAIAYTAKVASHADLSTFGNGRNNEHLTCLGLNACPTPPWEIAAVYGAIIAYHAAIDPARPFQTLELPGILPPSEKDRFTQSQRNILLFDGVATSRTVVGAVQIERAITTYQVNGQDVADPSYLDVNTLATLAFLRYSERQRIALRFPRVKLADDDTIIAPGQAIVTPSIIRDELIALYREWERAGLVENVSTFVDKLVVERDGGDPNRVNVLNPADLINQFRVYASKIQFAV